MYAYAPIITGMKSMTLKEARAKRSVTQEQLSQASGVDQSVISRIERGENSNPSHDTITKLETALSLKRGTLVFGREAIAS